MRLSVPCAVDKSELNTEDRDAFQTAMRPGAAAADAPVLLNGRPIWFLRQLASGAFTLLLFDGPSAPTLMREVQAAWEGLAPLQVLLVGNRLLDGALTLEDAEGLLARRFDGEADTGYLLRPDQHVCARWRSPDGKAIREAMLRALALHP